MNTIVFRPQVLLLRLSLLLSISSCLQAFLPCPSSAAKPIIGVNMDVVGDKPQEASISTPYTQAIIQAGGVPVLLPPMPADDLATVMPTLDGIMMIGGDDYPAEIYGKPHHPRESNMQKDRTSFDLMLMKAVLNDKSMPFLGICAGCQAMNIVDGGTLVQDIPSLHPDSKIKHASPHGWQVGFNKHLVQFNKDSHLAKIFGCTSMSVVSSHHQCVDQPGKTLSVAARSEDGLTEAIEGPGDRFLIGVQWHPERDFEADRKLFEDFIQAAAKHHNERGK